MLFDVLIALLIYRKQQRDCLNNTVECCVDSWEDCYSNVCYNM